MADEPARWEDWEWDETLFAGAAPYYERGRLPYAPGLPDSLADALLLDGRGRLLDVGCGPGTVALRLAHLFEGVVGLDPDAGMMTEAARLAAERGIANASWVRQRAEALPSDIGMFRVVTFAASFHWMDRPKVARAVRRMLDPGGAAVQVDAPSYRPDSFDEWAGAGPPPHPAIPWGAMLELRKGYLGRHTRAGQGVRDTSPSGEDDVFQAAGFAAAQRVVVPDGRLMERTIDDLVAMVLSSSGTAPHLFGELLSDFEADLRDALAKASPSGLFSVRLPHNYLNIWRPSNAG